VRPVVELQAISKVYGGADMVVRAVDGVDLVAERGDYLALMGASGSGKSTLMNIIGCLDVPISGRYLLDGVDTRRRHHRGGAGASGAGAAAASDGAGGGAGGGADGGAGGGAGGSAGDAPIAVGTVASANADRLTLTNFAGKTITVTVPPSATVTTSGLAGLKPGAPASVTGTTNPDGSVTATSITSRTPSG
jgi:energy-coupling factor transporter ATP-binding protein EcfA2